MKKAWSKLVWTFAIVFLAQSMTNSAFAKSKTAIEQTNYEKFYFGAMIVCLVLAVFTFFFRAKHYKSRK